MWDVFISHASEDKKSVARPLARELRTYCLRAWIDECEMLPGDSLRNKIDQGIAGSRLALLVLSPKFFAKRWPQAELDGLFARQMTGNRTIIPIWHEITADELIALSPLLAGILAYRTEQGIEAVAEGIAGQLGCKGRPLNITVDTADYTIKDLETLPQRISNSEDIPGSYAKRKITVSFSGEQSNYAEEIERGIRYLITLEPLTFPIRTAEMLSSCISAYVGLYNQINWNATGRACKLDLWRRGDTTWSRGVWLTPKEAGYLDRKGGLTDDLLDLGAWILARRVIPMMLFDFFRREQNSSKSFDEGASKLLALAGWTVGQG